MTKRVILISLLAAMAWSGNAWAQDQPIAAESPARPDGFSVGLGAGIELPSEITQFGVVSARVRLPLGLTIEPLVEIGSASQSMDSGGVETSTSTSTLLVAGLVRFPLIGRGPVDFLVLGGLGLAYTSVNPEGNDNNTTSSLIGVSWGVSVEYWISGRWSLSFTATNPVINRLSTTQQTAGDDATSTTTSFGLIFDPDLNVMVHLYF